MYDAEFTPPPTTKQLNFARLIAARLRDPIPDEARADRFALSRWIDARQSNYRETTAAQTGGHGAGGAGASSKQIGFAERIARARRRAVPEECYRSAALMSRWIDANK